MSIFIWLCVAGAISSGVHAQNETICRPSLEALGRTTSVQTQGKRPLRILLINPVNRGQEGYHKIAGAIPHLGLQRLAAVAQQLPEQHQVVIVDEVFGQQDFAKLLETYKPDFVGITGYTASITRGYAIADLCRAKGIQTIIGGPHVFAQPEEAARHADSIAVGEADTIWAGIIDDVAASRLRPVYEGGHPDLSTSVVTNAKTLQPVNGRYSIGAVQTSRGCPIGCAFCSVTRFNGRDIRRRPISDIVRDFFDKEETFTFIVDDNIAGLNEKHLTWFKDLMRAMIAEQKAHGRRKFWFSQTSINLGQDKEALDLAYRAGCRGMLIGFESLSDESLQDYHKNLNRKNLDHYQEMVDNFHRAGIGIIGAFIAGADHDNINTVSQTVLRAAQMGIDIVQITKLTPLPGTKLYDQMKDEGRLEKVNYPNDWRYYNFINTVFTPKNMTSRELDQSVWEWHHASADKVLWPLFRAFRTLWKTRSLTTAAFVFEMNRRFRKITAEMAPQAVRDFEFRPELNDRTRRIRRSLSIRP